MKTTCDFKSPKEVTYPCLLGWHPNKDTDVVSSVGFFWAKDEGVCVWGASGAGTLLGLRLSADGVWKPFNGKITMEND